MASYRSYLEQLAEEIQGYKDFNSKYTPQIDANYAEYQKGNPYQSKINSYQSQYENFNNTNQNYKTAQALNQQLNNYKYDPNKDNTYQQYMKSYINNGAKAMEDTLGVASARTGGLASSYALNAAQQTYNNYMQQLANKIPELAQLERSRLSEDYARNLGLSDKERAALADIRDSYRSMGQDRLNYLANLINTGRGLRQDEYSQVYQTGYNRLKDAYGSYKSLEDLAMQDEALELQRQQIAAQQAAARAAASSGRSGGRSYDDDDDDDAYVNNLPDGNGNFYISGFGYVSQSQAESLVRQGKARKEYGYDGSIYYIPNNADGSTKAIDYTNDSRFKNQYGSDSRYSKVLSDDEWEAYLKKIRG